MRGCDGDQSLHPGITRLRARPLPLKGCAPGPLTSGVVSGSIEVLLQAAMLRPIPQRLEISEGDLLAAGFGGSGAFDETERLGVKVVGLGASPRISRRHAPW